MSDEPADFPQSSPPDKTAIIGCNGRMGRMLMERSAAAGLAVAGVDQPFATNTLKDVCDAADMILICVPALHFEEVLCAVRPFLPPDAILADITSVKEAPMKQMEKYWAGAVVGTHPLFGPQIEPGADLPVAITPGSSATEENAAKVAAFFRALGCRAFRTTPEKHDQAMAKIQNMNFITNLAYFAVMAGQKDLLPFLTPSFERRKQAAAKMLTEDAEMFAGLFEANGHSHEAVRQYRKMLNLAASGDIDLLCHRAQWWWEPENTSTRQDRSPHGK